MDLSAATAVAFAFLAGAAAAATVAWAYHRRVRDALIAASLLDPLTGLGNRGALNRLYDRPPVGEQAIVVILDLDGFKKINDAHGHEVGDAALVEIAWRIRSALGPDARAFRSSNRGDEFIVVRSLARSVLVTDATDLARGFGAALYEAIEGDWKTPAVVDPAVPVIYLRASVGVTSGDPRRLRELLAAADVAMYEAKRTGTHHFYSGPVLVPAGRPLVRRRDTRPSGRPKHRAADDHRAG